MVGWHDAELMFPPFSDLPETIFRIAVPRPPPPPLLLPPHKHSTMYMSVDPLLLTLLHAVPFRFTQKPFMPVYFLQEVNEANLKAISHYLEQTLSPDPAIRKAAEKFLHDHEGQPGYGILLMAATHSEQIQPHIRQVAAVTFKNFIKNNWGSNDDGSASKINPTDRAAIKNGIIDLMVRLPDSLQKQFSEAISEMGKIDFPQQQWPELLPKMVGQFASGDFNIINGVLRSAHPLFKRYRFEQRSDTLWAEIKYVLDQLAVPLTQLFTATIQLTQAHAANPAVLKTLFHSLVLISKLFYTLNFQDLPEAFEDSMETWFTHFHQLLGAPDLPGLGADDPDTPGMMEDLKTQICENVKLYTTKYDEEFNPYVGKFVEATWGLLTSTDLSVKNDPLVSSAMKFLAGVCERECHPVASVCE